MRTKRQHDPIRLEGLIRICGGNPDFAKFMLDKFKLSGSEQIEQIRESFHESNWADVKMSAHSLKGSSAMLGAISISKLAAEIERDATKNELARMEANIARLQSLIESCDDLSY